MPFRSQAQRRYLYEQAEEARREGRKPPVDVDEWEEATEREHKKLPERKKPKKKSYGELLDQIVVKEGTGTIDWQLEDPENQFKKPNKKPKKTVKKSLNDIRRVLSQIRFN